MNILFLGLQYNKNEEAFYMETSKIGLQGAANTFQWSLTDGLLNLNESVKTYHTIPVGTYPFWYKKLIIKSRVWKYEDRMECHEIGFINLPGLKQICRIRNYYKKIVKWINSVQGKKVIIAYSLYYPYLKVFESIKKNYPDVDLCLIVTDLPCEYGILPRNPLKAFAVNRYGRMTLTLTHNVDKYILLTDQMKYPLEVGNKPYIIVEGICDMESKMQLEITNADKKIILYTGTLLYQFGIKNLMDAFALIENDNYELWICGSGEAEKEIQDKVKTDTRIKFYGFVSKKRIHEMQKRATLLINPRTNDGEYTKYSFPSKTMEYMASGTPVLMYKLDGIPKEYDEYIYYISGQSVENLKQCILGVCEKSNEELCRFGQQAKNFVLREKNSMVQAKKIIDMIGEF